MKLYRSRAMPNHWIGEDKLGSLMQWPAARGGWEQRTSYTGPKRLLEEVPPAKARGSGWPGGGRGPVPRAESGVSSQTIGLRATDDEHATWQRAADVRDQTLAAWTRDVINAAADRVLGEADADAARPRPKGKP